ncbi:hypothetical protein ACRC7T_11535 [Segnochrobactraceae bacterium EtOH-i3]
MTWVVELAEGSILLFGCALFVALICVHGVGLALGRRDQMRNRHSDSVGIIVGGMLGLLAFVLALTLSFANSRFTDHQSSSLAEANAIGTAWLRAKAIGTPHGEAIASLLETYTRVRTDFVRAGRDPATIGAINDRTSALQSEIWGHLAVLVRARPDPVTSSLMAALNDTFDASTKERFAYHLTLPPQLFWLLIGMTLVSIGSLGYQFGLKKNPSLILAILLTLMWTWVILEILDLASGRLGYIRTGTAVYEWTLQGFQGGLPLPPSD